MDQDPKGGAMSDELKPLSAERIAGLRI
jgi:hypothetical protein